MIEASPGSTGAPPTCDAEALAMIRNRGFAVIPGPFGADALAPAIARFDEAVAHAHADEARHGSTTLRVAGLLARAPELARIFSCGPVRDLASRFIGGPLRLSAFHARNVRPGAPAQRLHRDVEPGADGWPLLGFIFMVDAFSVANGATHFPPGSGADADQPDAVRDDHPDTFACGPAGSLLLFDGAVWHGHGANRTAQWRRSAQGALIPRDATPAIDFARCLPEDIFDALPPAARSLL